MASPITSPDPELINARDKVLVLLSGSNYQQWKQQMENLLRETGMVGFIDGTTKAPARKVIVDGREIENKEYESWKKSNDLVRKWIRDTITDGIKIEVKRVWTAKGLWTRFEKWYGTPTRTATASVSASASAPAPAPAAAFVPADVAPDFANRFLPLHKAAIEGNWPVDNPFIPIPSNLVTAGITEYSETALIVAVKSKKRNDFVKKLLEKMSEKDVALGDTRKRTALHRAAGANNREIAELLVGKNTCLPNAQTLDKRIPLYFAATCGHRDMVLYLLSVTRDESRSSRSSLSRLLSDNGYPRRSLSQLLSDRTPIVNDDGTRLGIEEFRWNPTPFDGESGFRILHQLTINGFYDIALALLQDRPQMAHFIPAPTEKQNDIDFHSLLALARKPSSFQSGTSFNWLQSCIYWAKKILWMIWKITYLLPCRKHIEEKKELHNQALELVKFLCNEIANSNNSKAKKIFELALFQATSLGIVEIVEEILKSYPDAIYLVNEDNPSIFHQAIKCRHAKVFNLIHQVGESRTIFLSQSDKLKNNALHLAGKLAPQQQLNLKAGAALQMQRELQWFKKVEKLAPQRSQEERNGEGKTPTEVFTDTHKDLVKEGERWMKDTANACTIVAVLIATIVFAAAITVPGGNNSDGNPTFNKRPCFIIFGIFDALAFFLSVTSVLCFVSILTSCYAEHDFLVSLPTKLICGLATLFLCILSTMIAFSATLHLVFGERYKTWIIAFACIPVALFVFLKFPLLVDMIKSTSSSIFVEQKGVMLY